MGSRYWVKDLDNPLQGENLLRGVNHINSINVNMNLLVYEYTYSQNVKVKKLYVTSVINVNMN